MILMVEFIRLAESVQRLGYTSKERKKSLLSVFDMMVDMTWIPSLDFYTQNIWLGNFHGRV
jgi:hypothetical protein